MRGVEIAAAASVSRARPIPPAQTHGGNGAVERWVPAARALPTYTPGLIYEFPDACGIPVPHPAIALLQGWIDEDAARAYPSYDPIDWPSRIALRQPDDPGVDPPAMRSAFSPLEDDGPEPSSSDRRAVTVICCLIALAAAVGLIAVVSLGAS